MWIYFVGENLNFAVSLLSGIAFLSASWLYLDTGKHRQNLPFILGFLFMGILALIQSIFPNHLLSISTSLLSFIAASYYYRKSHIGLEKHLTPLFVIFLLFSLAEILSVHRFFISTTNPILFPWVKNYGIVWFVRIILMLVSSTLLSRWVFKYLLKRLQTQVFIFFNFFVAIIFVTTTFSFSALIFHNLITSILRQTTIEAKMFQNHLTSLASQVNSDTQAFAQSPEVITALKLNDKVSLATLSAQFLLDKHYTSVDYNEISPGLVRVDNHFQIQATNHQVSVTQSINSTYLARYTTNTDQKLLLIADNYILASSFQPELVLGLKTSPTNPSSITLLGQDYFASYLTLTDADNLPLGSLVSVLPVTSIVSLATATLHTAFIIILCLELLFLLPAFFIARYLENQFS